MYHSMKIEFRLWTELTGESPSRTYRGRKLPDYTEKSVTGDFLALLTNLGRLDKAFLEKVKSECGFIAWREFVHAIAAGEEPSLFALRKNGEDKITLSSLDRVLPELGKTEQEEAKAFLAEEESRLRKAEAEWETAHPAKEPVSLPPSDRHDGGYGSTRWHIINGMF